jgi:hypothetical protein
MADDANDASKAEKTSLTGVPRNLAIFVVGMWIVIVALMIWHIGADEKEWSQWVTILTTFQGLAFAAAGVLWGVKVQAIETDKAKEGEKQANKDKDTAMGVAHAGKKLAFDVEHIASSGAGKGNLNILGDDANLAALIEQARSVRAMPLP